MEYCSVTYSNDNPFIRKLKFRTVDNHYSGSGFG